MDTTDKHAPNLDVLRALAVLFVVGSHALIERSLARIGDYQTQTLGTLGVLLFFVHTCLVLMRALERLDRTASTGRLALAFLAARCFRIYPLSVFVVLVLAVTGGAGAHAWFPPGVVASNLLLVQNLTGSPSVTPVLWSLPFEVQMYLFLPALYGWTRPGTRAPWRRVLALWCAAVVAVALLWRCGVDVDLIRFFPCFLPGVLAYCLRAARHRCPPAVLFLYVGANAIVYPWLVGRGASATLLGWVICLGLGVLLPLCGDVTATWLKTSAHVVAKYSYAVYLVHVTVLHAVFQRFPGTPPPVAWLLFAGGVAALAYGLHHLIEKPGMAYGHLLMARIASRRQAARHV